MEEKKRPKKERTKMERRKVVRLIGRKRMDVKYYTKSEKKSCKI